MAAINQLPGTIQAVSAADLLVLSQVATGGSNPGAVTTVAAPMSTLLALVPNQSAANTVPELPSGRTPITADNVVIVQSGTASLVPYSQVIAGQSIAQLSPASAATDTDTFPVNQGGVALVSQTMAAVNSYVQGKLPKYNVPSIEISNTSLVLDPTVHNGKLLIVSQPGTTISTSVALSSLGSSFQCKVVTTGSGTLAWGAGIITSNGAGTLPANSYAELIGFTYSGGATVFASVGVAATGSPAAFAPNSPTALSAGTVTSTSVALTWTASATDSGHSAATSYAMSYSSNSGASWSAPINVGNVTAYTLTGLTPSTAYMIEVQANNTAGSSAFATVSATTAAVTHIPNAPTSLAAGTVTSTSIVLNWTAPTTDSSHSAATGYSLTINGGSAITIGNVTTYTATGLTPSTSYTFSLVATNTAGSSSAATLTQATSANSSGAFNGSGYLLTEGVNVYSGGLTAGSSIANVAINVNDNSSTGDGSYTQPASVGFAWSQSNTAYPTTGLVALTNQYNGSQFTLSGHNLWYQYVTPPATAGTWYGWYVAKNSSGTIIAAYLDSITWTAS